ncbi:MAG: divalent-cation tolerance protein CutA [Oligoflexia bacterium]|nr:divalent-cation tolerance protein CutA [Oligoflexia bacterium]
MTDSIIVYVTVPDQKTAEIIAVSLLEEKLCACVNMLSGVKSLFWWDNKIDNAEELLLMIKTRQDLFEKLQARVKKLHPYDVPEIIAVPIVSGNKDYLDWLNNSVS